MKPPAGSFLLFFLPVAILGFAACKKYRPDLAVRFLLFVSLIFYAFEDIAGLPLLFASITFNYWISGRILRAGLRRSLWASLGVALNLLPLIYYKYGHPVIGEMSHPGQLALAAIPLGLSFYTFQQITCLFDIQRKDMVRLSFAQHALFAALFAQIPAGPISSYRDLAPQIAAVTETEVPLNTILKGVSLFFVGMGKKIILADNLGRGLAPLYAIVSAGRPITLLEAWITAWATLLLLYLDFSAYSDMALGIGLCFGLSLPVNFNSPLKAASGSEFIDRWHISLVHFVREYLYQPIFKLVRKIPLGTPDTRRVAGWIVATIVSMGALGAWHGSQITLLVSGLISGLLLVLFQLPGLVAPGLLQSMAGKFTAGILSRVTLLVLLSVLGLATKADSPQSVLAILHDMVNWRSISVSPLFLHLPGAQLLPIRFDGFLVDTPHAREIEATIFLGTLIVFYLPNTMQIFGFLRFPSSSECEARVQWRPTLLWGIAVGLLAAIAVIFAGAGSGGFIYAQF